MAQTAILALRATAHTANGTRGEAGTETVQCWRCGVDFDPTPFIPGAPCRDCQDFEEPTNEWTKFDEVAQREVDRKNRHVERLWKRRYSDGEIADALGISREVVRGVRKRLGLEAHVFKGDEKWKNPEEVRRKIGDRMRGQHYKQGWKKGEDGVYRNPAAAKK